MKKFKALVLIIGLASISNAKAATCYVMVSAPCKAAVIAPNKWFADYWSIGHTSAAACFIRAKEYKAWCGVETRVLYQVNGVNIVGAVTTRGGSTYITDGGSGALRFHD